MGWLSLVRERLSSKYGRLGLLGLLAAACLGGVLLGRAGRSGSDAKPSSVAPPAAGAADAGSAGDAADPPIQISGTWAEITSDGSPSERFRVFREDGVYIERYYGYEETGRWEALPDGTGVRTTVSNEKPVIGRFVNGELHVPRPWSPLGISFPMVFRRQSSE